MSAPVVTLEQGQLRGSTGIDYKGQKFLRFQGIPYAKPPIGELRFKAPQPPDKWSGVLDATKEGSACYSVDMLKLETIVGSEDCLVLNVYTSTISNKLKPVMFWIHGGGFVVGSSSTELYGPEFLVNEDVVLVTINYRLGMLGFLSLEDPALGVPGNAGMKDMVMALKWVQTNISKFGGDPNNVTIFGESAGAASVHLLTLSPMAKGLFHKAILQSGCAINCWCHALASRNATSRIANILKLEKVDEREIYKHLMESSVEEIFNIQGKLFRIGFYPSVKSPIGITIEKGSHEQAFLSEDPTDLILQGKFNKVVFMVGYTTAEGMFFEHFKSPIDLERSTLEDYIPWTFGYELESPESKAAAETIKKFYYGNEEPFSQNIEKKFDLLTDSSFLHGIYVTIMNQFRWSQAPTYAYRVSVDTELNFFKKLMGITAPGVSHLDDVGYLFKHSATPIIKKGSREDIALRRFVKLWTNFAKFGNPTPKLDDLLNVEWKPLSDGNNLTLLDIGDDLTILSNPEQERINFWENLYANGPAGKKAKDAVTS